MQPHDSTCYYSHIESNRMCVCVCRRMSCTSVCVVGFGFCRVLSAFGNIHLYLCTLPAKLKYYINQCLQQCFSCTSRSCAVTMQGIFCTKIKYRMLGRVTTSRISSRTMAEVSIIKALDGLAVAQASIGCYWWLLRFFSGYGSKQIFPTCGMIAV